MWFERRAAAAENAAVSAVLEEVKGITESLAMPSKEGLEDKDVEDKEAEDDDMEEEKKVTDNGDAAGIILSAHNLKAMLLEPEPLLVSNGGHRISRAEPETVMRRKEEEEGGEMGGYFVRGVEGVQTLV